MRQLRSPFQRDAGAPHGCQSSILVWRGRPHARDKRQHPWNDPFRTPRSRWMTTGTGTAKPERAPVDDNPSPIGLGTRMVKQAPAPIPERPHLPRTAHPLLDRRMVAWQVR